jgi:outer membrane protein OmpA-like peptidoglycan-associated protein
MWENSMVKKPFLAERLLIVIVIALSLPGCWGSKRKGSSKVDTKSQGYLDMPLESCENPTFCLNDDVEAFVLEEDDQLTAPFGGAHVAYHNEPMQEYTLEQLDAKEELHVVYFPYDSNEPLAGQEVLLKQLAQTAQEWVKEDKHISCKGNSCLWHGTRAYNLALSYKRAYNVAQYLEKTGIPKEKIHVLGVGSDEPLTLENTQAGQAPNRRVEIYAVAA